MRELKHEEDCGPYRPCRHCRDRARNKEWRRKNPDKVAATKRRWRERNREKWNAYYREYRAKNLEANRAYCREYLRKWRKENPGKSAEYQRRWREKKRQEEASQALPGAVCGQAPWRHPPRPSRPT